MGSSASTNVRTISIDKKGTNRYEAVTKQSIGEHFRMKKQTGNSCQDTNTVQREKRIAELGRQVENSLDAVNKLHKEIHSLSQRNADLTAENDWLRRQSKLAETSSESRVSSISIEAGDDAIRLQLRQALHELKTAKLENIQVREERDSALSLCTQREARISYLERELKHNRERVESLEELVRTQLGEVSLGDVIFKTSPLTKRENHMDDIVVVHKSDDEDERYENSGSVSSPVSSIISCDRQPSIGKSSQQRSITDNRRRSTKRDSIANEIDQLLNDLPKEISLRDDIAEEEDNDQVSNKSMNSSFEPKTRIQPSAIYRKFSIEANRQKIKDRNVFSFPPRSPMDKVTRPVTAAPIAAPRRSIFGRNASVPNIDPNRDTQARIEEKIDSFMDIDDLLNAAESSIGRTTSGKSRDSGFTDVSSKTIST